MENIDLCIQDYPETEHPSLEDIISENIFEFKKDKAKSNSMEQSKEVTTTQFDDLSEALLVFDREKHTLQAVNGFGKNGKINTVEPKSDHNPDFIHVDKTGDFLSNFYSNFMRQVKDPTRFRIFKVPIPRIGFFSETIKNILENPTPAGEAMLKKYEVTTENNNLEKSKKQEKDKNRRIDKEDIKEIEIKPEMKPENNNHQKTKTMETPTTTAPEYRYKVEDIDWKTMNTMGVTQEKLQKMNLLDDLLRGFKTKELVPISLNLGTAIARTDARLSLQPGDNGETVVVMHGVRKEPALHFPFFGHTFTEEDKKNLLETGNMGRIVHLDNQKTGETIPSIISVDRLTNELVALRADRIKIPDEIKGIKLSEEEKQTLLDGKPLYLEGMISNKGKEFSASVQFNADKRYVEFLFDRNGQNRQQTQSSGEAPRVIRGKELSEAQYGQFRKGETIYVNDLVDKKGQPYKGYLTYNTETGKTAFSFRNPNKQKQKAKQAARESAQPDESHKTQKAVNSDGKTVEATKHLKEALKKGQTAPTESQAEEQKAKKSRGRKM